MVLTEDEQRVLDHLLQLPPDYEMAECSLREKNLSSTSITKVAIAYVDECFLEVGDYLWGEHGLEKLSREQIPAGVIPGLHSSHVHDVIKMLLPYGLDPNAIIEDDGQHYNLMDMLHFVDNEYVAADTMALLLEHGGDPDLEVDGEQIFRRLDFDIWFGAVEQEIRWRYDGWVHLWMVLMAYSKKARELPIQVYREYDSREMFDLNKLKNHRNYFYGIAFENGDPWISIYDNETYWLVAKA